MQVVTELLPKARAGREIRVGSQIVRRRHVSRVSGYEHHDGSVEETSPGKSSSMGSSGTP